MLPKKLYQPELIKSLDDLLACKEKLPKTKEGQAKRWLFRGQKKSDKFAFETSIERAARGFGMDNKGIPDLENKLLREFKRRLHHYTSDVPQDDLEWLALMQHYGAPTRLLDWTYAFYVAVFFAIERENKSGYEIWALDMHWFRAETAIPELTTRLMTEAKNSFGADKSADVPYQEQMAVIDYLIHEKPTALVTPVNPLRLNDRLTIQQGIFLFPGDISKTFGENLCIPEYSLASKESLVRFSVSNDKTLRRDILEYLHSVNIDRATLFPGLAGFAESLSTRIAFLPEINRRI